MSKRMNTAPAVVPRACGIPTGASASRRPARPGNERDPRVGTSSTLLALTISLAITFGAGATTPAQRSIPTQARIEELVLQLANAGDARAAEDARARFGARAVPRLIACVEHPDTDDGGQRLLLRSARVLGRIGLDAEEALLPLAAAMCDVRARVSMRVHAAPIDEALRARYDPRYSSAEAVLPCDPEYELQLELATAYTRIARTAPTDVAGLMEALQSPNPVERELAVGQLAALGPSAVEAIGALERALQDSHPVFSLASAGGPAIIMVKLVGDTPLPFERIRHAVPLLDRNDAIRDAAARAMVCIAPDQPEVVSAYVRLLTHASDEDERREAVMALGRLGDRGHPASFLTPLLDDEDPAIVREVIVALGMIGPPAAASVPKLEELAEHEDRQISARARAALKQIRGQ